MLVILILVAALIWISFQTGVVGTPKAIYTLKNYEDILGDPFVLKVFWNTLIFTLATTFTALALGLPIDARSITDEILRQENGIANLGT